MDAPASPIDDDLLDRFGGIVGSQYALRDAQATAPYLVELRGCSSVGRRWCSDPAR